MRMRIKDWIEQYRHMDWAVLYMRLFAGGMMLLHNVGKMQNYNEIINSYPSFLYINNTATFVIITIVECVLAVLLIMGLWVRAAALVLALGAVVLFAWGGFAIGELQFVWLGVYIFLVISGGGIFGFDMFIAPSQTKK